MESKKKTLGELIELEVRKKGFSIIEFGKRINCGRNNIYNLFKRGDKIDVIQLKKISEVLQHNFFKELADDMDLITDYAMSEEEKQNEKAVSQFLNVVPGILSELGKEVDITFCNLNKDNEYKDRPIADYVLSRYIITFTVGDTLKDRLGEQDALPIEVKTNSDGIKIELLTNLPYRKRNVNITLDYKSEEEWRKTLKFAFEIHDQFVKREGYGYTAW